MKFFLTGMSILSPGTTLDLIPCRKKLRIKRISIKNCIFRSVLAIFLRRYIEIKSVLGQTAPSNFRARPGEYIKKGITEKALSSSEIEVFEVEVLKQIGFFKNSYLREDSSDSIDRWLVSRLLFSASK